MSKARGFSIVLHDVHKGLQSKLDVQAKVVTLPWRQYVIAEEPYNHQDGSHIHVFIQLRNPVYFTSMLKIWCSWWKSGRVQVDQMRGSMAQACVYITPSTSKEKHIDESPIIVLGEEDATTAGVAASVLVLPTCPHQDKWISSNMCICKLCMTPGFLDRYIQAAFPGWVRQDAPDFFSGEGEGDSGNPGGSKN